eukprot:TRINITY_DN10947_c0_g1_i2.p1 TRINITY_DN10947_c0_g1~~TRINITY_DN10947_c0_g1_i2.p1  ORF type:complete len:367 (+),score=50.38 TRINITY_DN10947_c0_g1_i2:317-1417(+)
MNQQWLNTFAIKVTIPMRSASGTWGLVIGGSPRHFVATTPSTAITGLMRTTSSIRCKAAMARIAAIFKGSIFTMTSSPTAAQAALSSYGKIKGLTALKSSPSKQSAYLKSMVSALDEGIGNITDALRRLNMMNDTIIVFTNENGGPISHPGNAGDAIGSSNWPWRGGKHDAWQGGVQGLAFLKTPPGMLTNPSYYYQGLMHAVDWFPTLAGLLKLPAPRTAFPMDGVDMSAAIINNGSSPRTHITLDIETANSAVRIGDWKLLVGLPGPGGQWSPSDPYLNASNNTPYFWNNATDYYQIYNLATDPREEVNLYDTVEPSLRDELMSYLASERVNAKYPMNVGPIGNVTRTPQGLAWLPWFTLNEDE